MLRTIPHVMVAVFILSLLVNGCNRNQENFEGISSLKLNMDGAISDLAWSPNGQYIAFTIDPGWEIETDLERTIFIVDLNTNMYHPIQEYDDRILYEVRGAKWSPDSRSLILYYPLAVVDPLGNSSNSSQSDIVILEAQTGKLLQTVRNGSNATWGTADNQVIIVDSDTGKANQELPIYQVDLNAGEFKEIAKVEPAYTLYGLDVSSTGLLAYRDKGSLQIIDIDSREPVGRIEVKGRLYSPAWSPDGQILAYIQDTPNSQKAIYLISFDGLCRSDPLNLGTIVKSIDWSPDGKQLAFSTDKAGEIYFLDLTIGVGKQLLDSYQTRCHSR
ncbi:MAG TPA: hypothetical protein ENJ93_01360 [Chloroflexi bacterium]|nr:hypothetical protein [Chloroflexota bacterium]